MSSIFGVGDLEYFGVLTMAPEAVVSSFGKNSFNRVTVSLLGSTPVLEIASQVIKAVLTEYESFVVPIEFFSGILNPNFFSSNASEFAIHEYFVALIILISWFSKNIPGELNTISPNFRTSS